MPSDLFLDREGVVLDARGLYGTIALERGDMGGRVLGALNILGEGDYHQPNSPKVKQDLQEDQ